MEEFLSVVIPAYNEEARIGPTLRDMCEFLKDKFRKFEIIAVDDGSADNTRSIVENLARELDSLKLISYPENQGKGYAVGRGVLASRGDLVLFSDADMSTPVEEVEKLIPFVREGFDVVIGSRGLRGSDVRVRQPWYRERMGKMFNFMVRLLTVRGITDTQCGFKLFKGEAARNLFRKTLIKGFSFDVEVLFLAEKSGYKVKEVPIKWFNSPGSKVRLFSDPLKMFLELLKIRAYYLFGRYAPTPKKRPIELPDL
ncbi:MAG: glycosyltransferase family 2 protein [Candidatus Sulfobium sp.]